MNDEELVRRFEAAELPLEEWHHREHIKIARIYLCLLSFDAALDRMRTGVKSLNASHGIVDEPARGYHETMTCAWMRLVELTLAEYGPGENADDFYEQNPQLSQKKILRLFYSREVFMSAQARHGFVEPDLAPLPKSAKRIRMD